MKAKHYVPVLLVIITILVLVIVKKKANLIRPGTLSPERKRDLAEQYKAQLDGIFTQASIERRELTAAEEMEVNKLQEKLIQLGFVYELPGSAVYSANHIFTPPHTSYAFRNFLN